MRTAPFPRAMLAALVAAACAACATPAERFEARLRSERLPSAVVPGVAFEHLVVRKPGRAASALHVYIEGDGRPWRTPTRPSDDPTPERPLAFELMLRDDAEAAYVGRPCYFGIAGPRCAQRMWTDARYADTVVASMQAVLETLVGDGTRRVRLIGYSGGGVVATLLARRMPNVDAVVTVGANLDVAAWSAWHRYTPLDGSLDPAALPPAAVREIHHVGSDDTNVPPALLRGYALGRANVEIVEWPRFDHVCCWADVWPAVLSRPDR